MLRRVLLSTALAVMAFSAGADEAPSYPTKPINLVVGYPAGGALDIFARALAQRMSEDLGQPILIENRPGASEGLAAQYVSKARADGYTVLASDEAPLTQNQFLYRKLPYDAERELTPVSLLVRSPMVLVVGPNFPAKSLSDFIATARGRKANPINIASYGTGGAAHLSAAMLAKGQGFEWIHVPYKGVPPILPDLVAGRVDATIAGVSVLAPYIKDRKIQALAVQADTRVALLPDVPTFKELGIGPIGAEFIIALSAPAGTPGVVVEKLSRAAKKVIDSERFREEFLKPNAFVGVGSSAGEFAAYLSADRPIQKERVKISGAMPD